MNAVIGHGTLLIDDTARVGRVRHTAGVVQLKRPGPMRLGRVPQPQQEVLVVWVVEVFGSGGHELAGRYNGSA